MRRILTTALLCILCLAPLPCATAEAPDIDAFLQTFGQAGPADQFDIFATAYDAHGTQLSFALLARMFAGDAPDADTAALHQQLTEAFHALGCEADAYAYFVQPDTPEAVRLALAASPLAPDIPRALAEAYGIGYADILDDPSYRQYLPHNPDNDLVAWWVQAEPMALPQALAHYDTAAPATYAALPQATEGDAPWRYDVAPAPTGILPIYLSKYNAAPRLHLAILAALPQAQRPPTPFAAQTVVVLRQDEEEVARYDNNAPAYRRDIAITAYDAQTHAVLWTQTIQGDAPPKAITGKAGYGKARMEDAMQAVLTWAATQAE